MGIVDEDVARVRAATDLVALAGEHMALRRSGRRWVGLCPFHAEKSPSFSVNAEEGLYYCFGCGASGDAITFVRELEHLDFVEGVEKLAARASITLRRDDDWAGRDFQRRSRLHEILDKAFISYHELLVSSADASAARRYLRAERGYDSAVVRRYRLGWAPERPERVLESLGASRTELRDAGLTQVGDDGRAHDFFRARVLFPILDPGGRAVGAGGRILPGGRGPKYKNSPNTAAYDKSRVLYGLNWAKAAVVDRGQVVVCEGYTDVIGLHLAGVEEAVATCGTSLAEGHIRLLTNFARRVVLAYDADSAGQAATERFYEWEKRFEVEIRVAALPSGSDPADLARSDPEALRAAVAGARPYLAFRVDRVLRQADMSSAEGRARAANEAIALVAEHPDPLVRDQYLMQVAETCRIDLARLRAAGVEKARQGSGRRTGTGGSQDGYGNSDLPSLEVPVAAVELDVLRLAVHRPEDVPDSLDEVLFDHALARSAFQCLAAAATIRDAFEGADPQTAQLLARLSVDEPGADAADVVLRLVERAGRRALNEVQEQLRHATREEQAELFQTMAWLKPALESLRAEGGETEDSQEALVAWLVERGRRAPGGEDR